MKTQVPRLCVLLAALNVALLSGASACADWFYDFNDGQIPETFRTRGINPSGWTSSTFAASAQSGVLRARESFIRQENFFARQVLKVR